MNTQEWLAETERRIAISEGTEHYAYRDTRGILTIGIGFNCERSDARSALAQCGVANIDGVLAGRVALTTGQVTMLFNYAFAPIVSDARASLPAGIFDALTDARRFVICDLVYNLGSEGWGEFANTRALIAQAQSAKNQGLQSAHSLFVEAAAHLEESDWFTQVGNRAKRDVAMLREGVWADPNGYGSDIS